MTNEYERILRTSRLQHKEMLKDMRHISKQRRTGFDKTVARIHDEVFAEIDCIECGNCCRTMSPRFRETDIKLLCKATGLDPLAFSDEYLKNDEEGVGYVLKSLPCPFQNEDNRCSVYEERTLSCKDFPHTQARSIQKNLVGLALDSLICPAAFLIMERIVKEY